MENASKALIMAATVLLGLMIISVGVALFQSFSDLGRDTIEKVENYKISEWNNTYLKYYGTTEVKESEKVLKTVPIQVTAHDIVSLINHARQYNTNNFGEDMAQWPGKDENYLYVEIEIKDVRNRNKSRTMG